MRKRERERERCVHLPLRRGLLQQVMGPVIIRGRREGRPLVVHQTSRWPVRAYYVTTLTVNIYQAGRPPPTRQRIVTLGWLSVEQKSRPKRSGRGASGMDRRGGPGGGEREREDRLKIPKWITPLRSWNRSEEGRIRHCCPHEWKFPFFFFCYRGSSIVRSFFFFEIFFICIGIMAVFDR